MGCTCRQAEPDAVAALVLRGKKTTLRDSERFEFNKARRTSV